MKPDAESVPETAQCLQAFPARQNPVLTHRLSPSAFSVVCQSCRVSHCCPDGVTGYAASDAITAFTD